MSVELAGELLRLFNGREDTVAVDKGDGFRPHVLKKPMTAEKLNQGHLSKPDQCLGFYLIREDGCVGCTALDFDNHNGSNPEAFEHADAAAENLEQLGLPVLREISQSGSGKHIWLCFEEPQPAALVFNFWRRFFVKYDVPSRTEHYPRQKSLDGLKLGNLIRWPLFRHSHFEGDGENLQILKNYQKITSEQFQNVCAWLGVTEEDSGEQEDDFDPDSSLPASVAELLRESPCSLLAKRWAGDVNGLSDSSNSAVLMAIATEFVRAYIPTPDIEEAIRYWGRARMYEKVERDDFVRATVRKAYTLIRKRAEVKTLSGNTFEGLAHQLADKILNNEEIIVPTGVPACDESFEGGRPQELVLLSARPNGGKTAFAMHWIDNAALHGFPCLLISLEMSPEESSRRVLLRVGGISSKEWKTAEGNQTLHHNLSQHYKQRAPVYFCDGAYTIERIEEVIAQYVQDYGVKVVCIDYQGLASAGYQSEYDNQTAITKALKQAARKNDVLIISLVQLKRTTDKEDGPPTMSDLKGGGELEASGDLILINESPYKTDPEADKDLYIVHVVKRRNGQIKNPIIAIRFDDERQTFF